MKNRASELLLLQAQAQIMITDLKSALGKSQNIISIADGMMFVRTKVMSGSNVYLLLVLEE